MLARVRWLPPPVQDPAPCIDNTLFMFLHMFFAPPLETYRPKPSIPKPTLLIRSSFAPDRRSAAGPTGPPGFRGTAAPLGARPPVGGRARTSGRLARGDWETRSGVACDTPMCFLKGEDVELELWKMPHLSEKDTSNTL